MEIMLVMPTSRRFLPGTPCFLGSCAIYIHSNVPMAPLCYLAAMAGAPPPTTHHPPPTQFTFLLLRHWLQRAKLCCFSAKSDRCDSTTRRSDGPRRYKHAGIKFKFNTYAERGFLRLPRSYRVAEKFDPIGSREPNCDVFQQITTVQQAQLDAPMDPSAINSQA